MHERLLVDEFGSVCKVMAPVVTSTRIPLSFTIRGLLYFVLKNI